MLSDKKERISWYLYDFANSVFTTSVITVFLGPYFTQLANNTADVNGKINLLGFINIAAGSFYPLIITISIILLVLILPVLSAIADNTKYKKHILFSSAYIGAFATMGLFFITDNNYQIGAALFIIANVCYGLSCTIYNSYLNHISTKETTTRISSIGWAAGYMGGGLLLIFNLLLYNNAEAIGISSKDYAVRICLASAGIWWAIFSLFPLKYLRNYYSTKKENYQYKYKENLINTFKNLKKNKKTLKFLLAYTLYNDGVQAVIVLTALFASEELGLTLDIILLAILFVQFIAVIGSLLFNLIAKRKNNLFALKLNLLLWIGAILFAFILLYDEYDFYVMCSIVGLTIGGTQAISRSIYSQLIPVGKETEYFSIYELTEKATSWLGPLIFAVVYHFTFSYRLAILSLVIFFVSGFVILIRNKISE